MSVSTEKITCVYATPYIRHAKYGIISHAELFTIAENAKKNTDIIDWLLKTSLKQIHEWYIAGFKPEALSIQVSLAQMENTNFVFRIAQTLHEYNTHFIEIIFEITEDKVPRKITLNTKSFSALRDQGVKFAIGLYTFGQFALHKAMNFPINYLHIDANLLFKHDNITQTIVATLQHTDIKLIVVGIETEEQKALLQAMGYDLMQGKIFDKHLPHLLPAENF
ncbi:MAG: EAL domain-containing protein [Gammaproteobacteria bacterium]|nr:MAG: EAL domain-containing protein [Gammaproteobacteria bacterium]